MLFGLGICLIMVLVIWNFGEVCVFDLVFVNELVVLNILLLVCFCLFVFGVGGDVFFMGFGVLVGGGGKDCFVICIELFNDFLLLVWDCEWVGGGDLVKFNIFMFRRVLFLFCVLVF